MKSLNKKEIKSLKPSIFEEATNLILEGETDFACHALKMASGCRICQEGNPYVAFFASYFKPETRPGYVVMGAWWGRNNEPRIFALLLAREILRDLQK